MVRKSKPEARRRQVCSRPQVAPIIRLYRGALYHEPDEGERFGSADTPRPSSSHPDLRSWRPEGVDGDDGDYVLESSSLEECPDALEVRVAAKHFPPTDERCREGA